MSNKAIPYPAGDLFRVPPEDVIIIGLDTDHGPEHHLWDERIRLPVKPSLITSIMADGVLEPVTLAKDGELLAVVNGRQRIRAAREANKELERRGEPPIKVSAQYKRDDPVALTAAMVTTNEHRTDDDIITRAAKAQRLVTRGMSTAEVAVRFGVTGQTIRAWLSLHALHPQLKEAFREGACTMADAIGHADATADAQRLAGLAYLDAAEGTAPKPAKEGKESAGEARVRRKRRSDKVIRRALADASPSKAAALAFVLDPGAKVDVLLTEHIDRDEVIRALAWVHGEDECVPPPA